MPLTSAPWISLKITRWSLALVSLACMAALTSAGVLGWRPVHASSLRVTAASFGNSLQLSALAPTIDPLGDLAAASQVSAMVPLAATASGSSALAPAPSSSQPADATVNPSVDASATDGAVASDPSAVEQSVAPASTDAAAIALDPTRSVTARGQGGSAPLAWSASVSPAFTTRVVQMCAALGCQPNDLMAAMAFESAETFSPSVRNPYSNAVGLIQFMPSTAAMFGTSTDELASMSAEDQLDYVYAYFQPYRGHLQTLSDVYMAVLWPRAVGQPDDYPLFVDGSPQYAQNAHLDIDGDGIVTKGEAAALVAAKQQKGEQPRHLASPLAQSALDGAQG